MTTAQKFEEADAPIEIYADDAVIDGGIAAIPKMLLRFARHLNCAGSQLNDRQVLLLVMVIALREDRNLRLSNLPMTSALSTLESDLAFLRKAGLVLTQRDYYSPVGGRPPRMRSQIWDIRSLHTNLAQVQKLWFSRQAQKFSEWRAQGKRGQSPIYEFPLSFQYKVAIPRSVLADIASGRFFPVPDKWLRLADQTFSPTEIEALKARRIGPLPTASQTGGRHTPTGSLTGSRSNFTVPTASNTGGHLVKTLLLPGTDRDLKEEEALTHFAARLDASYVPTGNDRKALKALQDSGYSLQQITKTIDEVFDRGDNPKRFAYCARIVRDRPPACPPVPLSELKRETLASETSELPSELERFVPVLINRSTAGDESGLRRQLTVMAESCETAAHKHRATGMAWLKDALERSIGKDDPLTYAAAILRSWSAHGPEADLRPKHERQPLARGIRSSRTSHTNTHWDDSIDA